MLDLRSLLQILAGDRPVFHSEADFQFALGWLIKQAHRDAVIRLEYKPAYTERRGYLDIWVKRGEAIDAIEVKYWKRALKIEVGGEQFDLASQGAQDLARYDFFSDLARIEGMVGASAQISGHVLALTNDPSYWTVPRFPRDTFDRAFRTHEGLAVTGELAWSIGVGGTSKGRERSLVLARRHELGWADYSTVSPGPAGTFRYLLADVVADQRPD